MAPPNRPQTNTHDDPRTALILYATETGNAQDLAHEISHLTQRLHFHTTLLPLDALSSLRTLLLPTVTIFVISTTGQGDFPQNARQFWKSLLSGALQPAKSPLRKLKFAAFGLGDSSYAKYNVAGRMLCARLAQLGAREVVRRGEGNEQHPEGHSAGFREWMKELRAGLLEVWPLGEGVEEIGSEVFLEPGWRLAFASTLPSNGLINRPPGALLESSGQNIPMGATTTTTTGPIESSLVNGKTTSSSTKSDNATPSSDPFLPSPSLLPIKDSHIAYIAANDRITPPDHFQDVRLMDLHLETPEQISYPPGAVAIIYPKNFPQDVQDFIDLMNWNEVADTPLQLIPTDHKNTPNDNTDNLSGDLLRNPSPLRHLHLSESAATPLTLRWLLENTLDIQSIPRRSFFSSLLHFASSATEDESYQKERLTELANPELIDELWDYTTRPKRTILEVMMDFTTVNIPWMYALSTLPMMRGRLFSIASGGHLRHVSSSDGRTTTTRVQLLVAIADPVSPIIKWRRRYGVCTRYIAELKPGQRISVGIQEGYLDVGREGLSVPNVMVGPGTGVAPLRSLIWQRILWAAQQEPSSAKVGNDSGVNGNGKGLDGDILIFGCRNEKGDYFFREEWEALGLSRGLRVLTAFSRDRDKRKEYVQDRIRAEGRMIREALVEKGGKVYVCGSSGNMPKGVREALVDVLVEGSGSDGWTREDAEGYLEGMEKGGRYLQETW